MEISPLEMKAHYTNLLHLHVQYFGKKIAEYLPVSPHGSDRIIIRLISEDGSTSIGIGSSHVEENKAFLSFGRHFRSEGLNIPEVYAVSGDNRLYLMEDLGDETLFTLRGRCGFDENIISLYKKVFDDLPKFQVSAGKGIDYSLCYQFAEFGEENILFDLNYFRERFLRVFFKENADEEKLNYDLDFLKNKVLRLPRDFFLYRDFQSRNIMIKGGEPYFIDFQSGRKGALLYDAASMLYDAKADIPQDLREKLLEHYLFMVSKQVSIDTARYKEYFWYFALVRILQAMGAYGYLGIVKGKRKFLESVPYALKNINFILNSRIDNAHLKYLRELFKTISQELILEEKQELK